MRKYVRVVKLLDCYIVLDDIWIPLGESLLIEMYSPIWNKIVDGFGNHDPGSGRYNQQRSRWDVLHPGRNWALKLKNRTEAYDEIVQKIREFIEANSKLFAPDPDSS